MTKLDGIIIGLLLMNIIISIYQRRKLTKHSEVKIDEVPEVLLNEVRLLIDDGYKLMSVNSSSVKLIKKKNYWFSWLFFLSFPNITITSSFLCNIYGVKLNLINNEVDISTF